MATLEQLPAERRAILELVLRRGRSYEELAELLDMPAARVREHAREALASLAPRSAERVDQHWRGQVADYLLGQQEGPQASATRAHLKSSEAARTWALSVLDSVGDLLPPGREPQVPSGGGRSAATPAPAGDGGRGRARPPSLAARGRRRLLLGVAALAAVAGLAFLATQLLDDGGDEDAVTTEATEAPAQPEVVAQTVLRPVGGARGGGGAVVADQGGQPVLLLQAELPPIERDQAYVVWLYNSPRDAVAVAVPQLDRRGGLQALAPLPAEFDRFRFVDVSLQERSDRRDHSGNSVLRGALDRTAGGAAGGP